MTIAELAEDRVVEAVYAVRTKRKLRTKSGAAYLALELVDPTGRIEARVWNDVELLDGRFTEGDAVRVLGRVEKFRDRLQLDVRSLEASDVDPTSLTPALRRDADELRGFLDFLVSELAHPGLAATVRAVLADRDLAAWPATPDDHHSYAGGLLEHTVGVATLCRETAQLHPRLRPDLLLAAALVHDVGRTLELGPRAGVRAHRRGPAARPRPPRATADRGARGGADRGPARGAPALRRVASRRARGANGGGVGALPREPARRGRSDAQGRLTPLLLALGASLAWGVADFVGPLLSRTLGLLRIMFWAQVGGLAGIAIAVAIRGEGPAGWAVLFAVAAAIGGTLGLFAYYRGMQIGAMSVVAPIAGASAVIPVVFGIATGDDPSRRRSCAGSRARSSASRSRRSSTRGLAPRRRRASGWRCSPRSASASTSRGCTPRARSTSGGRR